MTDYDFFELGATDPKQKPTRDLESSQVRESPRQFKNYSGNYEEDFYAFEYSLKKSDVHTKLKPPDHQNPNIKSANLKQTLARQAASLKKHKYKRSESMRLAHNSTSENRYRQPTEEDYPISKYSSKVTVDFPELNYETIGDKAIAQEVERVRATIRQFNEDLNQIMERNQELLYKQQKMAQQKMPSVEDTIKNLETTYNNNNKVLYTQANDSAKLQKRIADLEGKDPVIKLRDDIEQHKKIIDDFKKYIRSLKLLIEKTSKTIKISSDAQEEDAGNFKKFNELRTQTSYLQKKTEYLQKREEELKTGIYYAYRKDEEINMKFKEYRKTAEDKCLEVTTNKNFVYTKKKIQELTLAEDFIKKNIDVIKRKQKQNEYLIEKDMTELRKYNTKIDDGIKIKETEVAIIMKYIKVYIAKCPPNLERSLRQVLARFSYDDTQSAPIPRQKQRPIDTSSTIKNADIEPNATNLTNAANPINVATARKLNKVIPAPQPVEYDYTKPLIYKPKKREAEEKKERQWKIYYKIPQPPEVYFAIEQPKKEEKQDDKMIFRFSKGKKEADEKPHNISMPQMNDKPEVSKPKYETKYLYSITIKPKLFKPRRSIEVENSTYIPSSSKQEIEPYQKEEASAPNTVMINLSRKRQSSYKVDPPKPKEEPYKVPYLYKPKLRPDKPTKVKIEKYTKPKNKYDIFAAYELLVEDVYKNYPKFHHHYHNKEMTLQELLGSEGMKKNNDDYDDLLMPTKPLKKTKKGNDLFADLPF